MASRTDRFIDDKFSARVNPKDGFAVAECKEARARRVLEFLVPLLYPEKPTRVTIMVGNTIFGTLSEERPVDWGQVVKDIVQQLFFGMGKSKATLICPYVFHMYYVHEVLLPDKKKEYWIKEALLKHNVKPEEEEDPEDPEEPEDSEDSDRESLSSKEIREIQKQEFAHLKKSPHNKRLTFNQKLEAYVGHTSDVVNKTRLFDAGLAKNLVSAGKVIPILVDFVEKMEGLLDEMRALFDRLQPEVPLVVAENLLDISGEIPSLTGWGRETTPMETPTKLDQSGPSEPTREEEVPTGLEYTSPPRRQVVEPVATHREVPVNTIVKEVVKELRESKARCIGWKHLRNRHG